MDSPERHLAPIDWRPCPSRHCRFERHRVPTIAVPHRRYIAGRLEVTEAPGARLVLDPHTMMVTDENGEGVVTLRLLEQEPLLPMPEARAIVAAWHRGENGENARG